MDRSRRSTSVDEDVAAGTYTSNGKVLLAAVILLSVVLFFVILLHVYARWFLGRNRPGIARIISRLPLQTLASHIDHLRHHHDEVPCFSKGLDPRVVASLPVFVCEARTSTATTSLDCVVCLSALEEGEAGRELPRCGHVFHVECVDTWLVSHSTCPLCRAAVAGEGGAVEEEEEVDQGNGDVIVDVDIDMAPDASNTMKGDEVSSSSASSCSSSLSCCSLKGTVSKARSESQGFPLAIV